MINGTIIFNNGVDSFIFKKYVFMSNVNADLFRICNFNINTTLDNASKVNLHNNINKGFTLENSICFIHKSINSYTGLVEIIVRKNEDD